MSNPNTQHQTWGRWVFHVTATLPPFLTPDFESVRQSAAQWFTKVCRGGAAFLNLEQIATPSSPGLVRYVITLRWDRRDVLDVSFQRDMRLRVERFFTSGLGPTTTVTLRPVVIEAGDAEDGKPPAQLLILPAPEASGVRLWGQ